MFAVTTCPRFVTRRQDGRSLCFPGELGGRPRCSRNRKEPIGQSRNQPAYSDWPPRFALSQVQPETCTRSGSKHTDCRSSTNLSKYPERFGWCYAHDAVDGLRSKMFIRRRPTEHQCHVRILYRVQAFVSSHDADLQRR